MTADKILVFVLTLLTFAGLVWLEVKSRRNPEPAPRVEAPSEQQSVAERTRKKGR